MYNTTHSFIFISITDSGRKEASRALATARAAKAALAELALEVAEASKLAAEAEKAAAEAAALADETAEEVSGCGKFKG